MRYLDNHDPEFLDTFQAFLAVEPVDVKIDAYAKAAAIATNPMGFLWSIDATVMNFESELGVWQELLENKAR